MNKKIVFMGTPLFAVPILKALYQNGYPISVVFTQPEKKSQRGMGINRTPIQSLSETLNLEFRTPLFLKNSIPDLTPSSPNNSWEISTGLLSFTGDGFLW